MKEIKLRGLKLKTFTEQNVEDYCLLNNINPLDIKELNLSSNELTDISGVKLFKNLKQLDLFNNKIKDISSVKDLNKLKYLNISVILLTDISDLKDLKKLKYLN